MIPGHSNLRELYSQVFGGVRRHGLLPTNEGSGIAGKEREYLRSVGKEAGNGREARTGCEGY